MKLRKNVDTNLSITIILVFASLFIIIDFILIGNELDGYPFGIAVSDSVIEEESDNVGSDVISNEGESYIRTTSVDVIYGNRDTTVNVSIVDGELNIINDTEIKEVIIGDEKIKCIHYDYYQSSDTNVLFILTEAGNVYVNEFYVQDSDINIFNNFVKINYTNVSEFVLVNNPDYGTIGEVDGIVDNKQAYVYALIDDSLVKLDNQYAM